MKQKKNATKDKELNEEIEKLVKKMQREKKMKPPPKTDFGDYEYITEWTNKKKEVFLKFTSLNSLTLEMKDYSKKVLADQDHIDALRIKNQDMKNKIETIIYDMKEKVTEPAFQVVTSVDQRNDLSSLLASATEWLEEEASTANLTVSREKLRAIEKLLNPINFRINELDKLPKAFTECSKFLSIAYNIMLNISETREVTEKEIDAIMKDVTVAQEYISKGMAERKELKDKLYETSSYTSDLVNKRCDRIMKQIEKLSKNKKKVIKKEKKPEPLKVDTEEKVETNTETKEEQPSEPTESKETTDL